ncbi:stringent starvation protein B [Candidatus Photodesmus katoptron Akat1]|uniref:Stringent starvation protein B n=2 Tax=Candidatus Photodesmus anomalopis TaxID=28176 RepID=S3DJB5_9GAMM|nr:stringent starvation protein B [Candidatus Photodesmus katoptron Akat1]
MIPFRPYILRAFYDWLVDNRLTPYLVVNANVSGVSVPEQFIKNGQITFNISTKSVVNLELGNDMIKFNARFSGFFHSVVIPLDAIQAIYAHENGIGTMFHPEETYFKLLKKTNNITVTSGKISHSSLKDSSIEKPHDNDPSNFVKKGKSHLRVVK